MLTNAVEERARLGDRRVELLARGIQLFLGRVQLGNASAELRFLLGELVFDRERIGHRRDILQLVRVRDDFLDVRLLGIRKRLVVGRVIDD